nr:hypothetical protein [Lysobacter enzymogenes]
MSKIKVEISTGSDGSIAFDVPLRITKRGYRKLVQLTGPETARRPWDAQPTALQRALGRAERWRRMLESGEAASLKDLSAKEDIDLSYIAAYLILRSWLSINSRNIGRHHSKWHNRE